MVRSWWSRHPRKAAGLVLLLAAVFVFGIFIFQAAGASSSQTRVPTGTSGTPTGTWTPSTGTTVWGVVDDAAPLGTAGDGDYVTHGTTAGSWWGTFTPFNVPAGSTITRVSVYTRGQRTAAQAVAASAAIRVGGNSYTSAITLNRTAWTDNQSDWATNPKTGLPWTVAEVNGTDATNALQLFGVTSTDANPTILISQIYIEVAYTSSELVVTQGTDVGRPTSAVFAGAGQAKAVDELSLQAIDGGSVTVSQIVVTGLDTAASLQTDVSAVRLFIDDPVLGSVGSWDPSDTQLGTAQSFNGQASGSTATFSGLNHTITSGTTENVWIVYTMGASPVDGHLVGSRVNAAGGVTASSGLITQSATITSAASGQTLLVDAVAPAANTSDPLDSAVLTGSSKTISGTASDARSGVSAVQVRIMRSDNQYWNGTGWTGTETWVAATGTTNWTYAWALDAGQNNGPFTYTITSRATDGVGLVGTDATPVTGVKVDNVAPTMVSATTVNATTVDVLWSEALQSGSITASDFTIAGLTVSNAVLQPDNVTVRLTTTAQTPSTVYTVQSTAGNVLDIAGNGNTATSANFTGFIPAASLTVAQGADVGRPTALTYALRSANKVADEYALTAAGGTVTLTQLVVRGLDTVGALQTDVSGVSLYRDNGPTVGQWDGGDTQLGTAQTFSGQASGSTATFSGLSLAIPASTTEKIWVVYTIGASAVDGHVVGAQVQNGDVTVTGGSVNAYATITSAASGQTIQVDALAPTVNTSDPLDNAVLTGASKTVSGTAADSGSGLSSVQVRIMRSDTQYWTGSGWSATETWLPATGTTNWTYAWSLDAGQNNGPNSYTITARATDNLAQVGTDATPVAGVKVDNVTPSITSASAINATTADVVWSEPVQAGSLASTDFTIAGLTVSNAVLQADNVTVRLTTSAQAPNTAYTVQSAGGNVLDIAGNANALTTAGFTGYAPPGVLTVTQGSDGGRPTSALYAARSAYKVVDELALSASTGPLTLSQVVVRGLDTAATLQTDVSGVRLFRDNGATAGQWDGSDTQLGGTQTFSGQSSGSTATFSALGLAIPAGTTEKVWVVYTIGASAVDTHLVGSQVQNGDVSVSGGSVNAFATITSAASGQTIQVDASAPSANTSDPLDNAILLGSSKTISGTASDGSGSGVASVEVRIARSDGQYWNGTGWTGTETWRAVSGTTNWTYAWSLTAGQNNGPYTYTITARATDGVALVATDPTPVTGVKVDNVTPSIASAVAVDESTVDVVWSEALQPGSVSAGDFSISGLTVTGAALQPDNVTVRLTTSAQTPNLSYTVQCLAGNVLDVAGNANALQSKSFMGFSDAIDNQSPSTPADVVVTAGLASPNVASLTWTASTDNMAVTGYRIYRAARLAGPYEEIGTTVATSFSDTTGIPGQDYYYKVAAYDAAGNESELSTADGPVHSTWAASPHITATDSTRYCSWCHTPHQASASKLLRDTGATPVSQRTICYNCHDGRNSAANVATGTTDSFALNSGHSPEWASSISSPPVGTQLTNDCASCHSIHRDASQFQMLPRKIITTTAGSVEPTTTNNSWCEACHNDANSWYGPGYPATPSQNATGYPTVGTYPGATAYEDDADNAHSQIPASATTENRPAGSCLYCHAAHRAPGQADGLRYTLRPTTAATLATDQTNGTYAQACFYCHGGTVPSELATAPVNIKQFVTGGSNGGHRIQSSGGNMPAGSPMPCYDCHNPHGSAGPYGLTVLTQNNGTTYEVGDSAGEIDFSSAAGTRQFCFLCHTTADATPQGTDPSDGVGYVNITAGGTSKIEGLDRTVYDAGAKTGLKLPAVSGHYAADTTKSCYTCHGNDYGTGTSNNIHNMGPGASSGGLDCFTCHSYQSMQTNSSYHHYMASDAAAPYPMVADPTTLTTSDSRRTCLICHVDHDFFDPSLNTAGGHTGGRAQNLRASISVTPSMADGATYANTDQDTNTDGVGGVCVSCHQVRMDKNTANRDSSRDRFAKTQPIVGGNYYLSAHNYASITSTFTSDSSKFNANCAKCHNDDLAKAFQDAPNKFGTHDGQQTSLQMDGGQSLAADPEEQLCWLCHSKSDETTGAYNPNGGVGYGGTGSDFYGTGMVMDAMMEDALNLKGLFTNPAIVSKHPINGDGTTTARVECVNCHNVHKTAPNLGFAGDGVAQNPDNTLSGSPLAMGDSVAYFSNPAAGSDYATNRDFCLKCHDGVTPTKINNGTSFVPYDVYIPASEETNPNPSERPNKSRYLGRSHFNAVGADTSATAQTIALECATCHDRHGSTLPSLLGKNNAVTGVPTIAGAAVTGNNNTVCYACHTSGSGGTFTYDGTGYPMTGPWPGQSNYDTAYNATAHTGNGHLGAVWPGRSYAAGDCKNCHDVHGTANDYDQLRTENAAGTEGTYGFASDDMSMCFNCHDGDPAGADIKSLYPASAGGTSIGARSGHRVLSDTSGLLDATLGQGDAVPCYDCHNPHGSKSTYQLQVRNIGDDAGDAFDLSDASGVREFCFACHLTSDTHKGWNGTAYAAVSIGVDDEVEGITRDSASYRLLLPNLTDHQELNGSDCFTCHTNPHEPSGGVSNGGVECYTCHKSYQQTMDADGTNRVNYYHHVLGTGGGTFSGDNTYASGSYPGAGTSVYCMSCHVDHNTFNASKSGNLRADLTAGSAAANTDFPAGGGGNGVCVGCHSTSLVKDTANQKSSANGNSTDASTRTPMINGTDFPGSAHNYAVNSTFNDATSFAANCSKCHNDENIGGYKTFQTSDNKFGPHFSSMRRLLTAFGVAPTDPIGDYDCYGCHAPVGSYSGAKSAAGKDWYGTANMSSLAEKVYSEFFLTGSQHPVQSAGGTGLVCVNCHNTHVVSATNRVSNPENTYNLAAYSTTAEQAAYCLKCHDATLPAYQVDGTAYVPKSVTVDPADLATHDKTTNAARGHWSASGSISSGETVACGRCHDNHGSNAPKLLGEFTASDNSSRVNNHIITANDNTVCFSCHDTASSSFPAGEAQREAGTGYLTDGTWPGQAPYISAYNASTHLGNGHLNAQWPGTTYAAGDCKNCHNVHGTGNTYDELKSSDGSGSYAFTDASLTMCFKCHGANAGTPGYASTNIAQYYPAAAGGTGTGDNTGHQIKTAGGNLAVGQAMPCYNCHNPHGSRGQFGLQVRDIGDVAGEIDISDDAGVREFCFTCHSTSDATTGWNGTALVAVGTTTVEGLRRDGSDGSALKLPTVNGHRSTDGQSCYQCHLNSTTNNPHNPSPGVSSGGITCYTCHTEYQTYMEDDSGALTGANNATVYHHVLGGAAGEGDIAPNTGAFQTSKDDVYCTSCHTDHNYFNATDSSNLRTDVTNASGAGLTDTDYSTAGNVGICTSCHVTSRAKQGLGTEQKNGGTTATPKILAGAGANQFGASAHNYATNSTFGDASTFKANCSKCHNDENSPAYKTFQTSTDKFGTHWSAERRILSSLGAALTDPLSETACYGCHSGGTAGNDYYGAKAMTQASRLTQAQFGLAYKHPVVATGGNSVECANCHNPHVVTAGTGKVTDPANTYNTIAYSSETEKAAFCLKCHDGSLPAATVDDTTYVPSSVTIAAGDQPMMNKSTNATRGHWSASGSISAGEVNSCGVCHAKHGSSYAKMLGAYDPATQTNKVNGAAISGNNNTVCSACHTSASTGFAAPVRDASGYPTDGTWPGNSVYSLAYDPVSSSGSMHNTANAQLPGKTYTGGDCKNCHDVHGTANTLDELRTEDQAGTAGVYGFSSGNFTFCFNCHDTDGPAARNVKTYFPASVGGSGGGSGHEIKTAGGTLAVGGAVPCYDCHNPHGSANSSFGLTVVSAIDGTTNVIVGDGAGEIQMSPAQQAADANNIRKFCFTCHTTADTTKGWNGSALVAISAGAKVEGIDRTTSTVLHLPARSGHNEGDTTQNCYSCHGNDYSTLTSNNVHNPSGGVSLGGSDCYTCHGMYQTYMEDGTGTKTGASRATKYHHVMGGTVSATYYDGDKAFASGAYPTAGNEVFCLSCHVDHNRFNSNNAANLRDSATIANPSGASADYSTSLNTGVCVGCHTTGRTKQNTAGADMLNDGSTTTPKIVAGAGANQFGASAHSYYATSTYGDATTFNANCSKCHNDENSPTYKDFQTSTNRFGTHWSAERRLLSAFGAAVTDPLSETNCYGCHKGGTAGNDYYGTKAMTQGARATQAQFGLTSKHPVVATGGNSVECVNCHNPHVVTATTGKVTDPANTYNTIAFSTDTEKATFCLKCHSAPASLPAYTVNDTTYIPSTVTITAGDQTKMNQSTNAARGHWSQTGAIGAGEEVNCAECHDNHGSNVAKLLGVYDPASGTNKIGATTISANDNTVCYGCHSGATGTAYTRLANGYPNIGTWPGSGVYTGGNGIHRGATVVWPGSTYTGGDCKNCHDVHGTAYTYDELVGQFNPASAGNDRYALCFNCHDGTPGSPSPAVSNIKALYPTVDGGTGTTPNAGHQIKTTGGTLAVGQGLPCYDCHDPHGSGEPNGLVVETMINGVKYRLGDLAAGTELGSISALAADANNVRMFCLTCHATAAGEGTNSTGTGYTAAAGIKATDLVEGLSRTGTNKLKLSSTTAAHLVGATTDNCFDCHGGMTASSTSNAHNPSGGAGNDDCLVCHGATSTERLDNMLPTGTSTYHHVLDAANPDSWNTAYPNTTTTLECRSCHVDHAHMNTAAGNLRGSYNDAPTTGSGKNSDYAGTGVGAYSICMSCHSTAALTKDTRQASLAAGTGASAATPQLSNTDFDASAHDYQINDDTKVGYGTGKPFLANCIKCHDDYNTAPSSRQKGSIRLAPHYSAENRIAQAFGVALSGTSTSSEENQCYLCHITAAGSGTDAKTVANRDAYNVTAMSANSEAIWGEFQKTYTHPIDTSSGLHKADEGAAAGWNPASSRHVECEDCHNVHAAKAGTTPWPTTGANRGNTAPAIAGATAGVWGVGLNGTAWNWTGLATPNPADSTYPTYTRLATAGYQWQLCLKCHSTYAWGTTPPTVSMNLAGQTGGKQTDVGEDFSPTQLAYHPLFAVGKNQPTAITWWDTGNKGSYIVGRKGAAGLSLTNTMVDGWTMTSIVVCTDCHNNDNTAGPSGPHGSNNRWLLKGLDPNGKITYQTTKGTFVTDNTTVLGTSFATNASNMCLNCHRTDVYGGIGIAGSTYSTLSRFDHKTFQSACINMANLNSVQQWSNCLGCHGGRKDANSFTGKTSAQAPVQSGAIHGTSLTYHPSAATFTGTTNYMGQRFLNGSNWSQHKLDKTTTANSVGCYNFTSGGTFDAAVDTYSDCVHHTGDTYTANYAY